MKTAVLRPENNEKQLRRRSYIFLENNNKIMKTSMFHLRGNNKTEKQIDTTGKHFFFFKQGIKITVLTENENIK